MTFYEQELRKLFADGTVIGSPKFTGRACLGTLGKDLRARVQFVTSGHADHYDVIGVKQVPGNPNFRNGVAPHIWEDSGKVEWYAFRPSAADYSAMRQAVSEYLGVFRDRVTERRQDGPRLVYICAPLRGEVEKNIAFARDKAREVFAAGNVPICPHLMFPPIADPENPAQDQAAREMGLRLVESCQQVNVYGPVWTEGMWAEINHAERLGIPVLTDQKELGKPPRRRTKQGKER